MIVDRAGAGLSARAVTVSFGATPILHSVDFDAPAGAVTALIGPNGSGKTTLLRCLAGLLECEGTIQIGGEDSRRWSRQEHAQRVAYVPQRTLLDTPLPVLSVVGQGRFTRGRESSTERREAVDRALEVTGVAALVDRAFTTLSGGERQRVLLARALATGATTLLLDEPTSAQDISQSLLMARTLRGLATADATIVMVVHDLREVRQIADHAVLLDGGAVSVSGPAHRVAAAPPVRSVFGVELLEKAGLDFRLPAAEECTERALESEQ